MGNGTEFTGEYLGDSVYAEMKDGMVRLTTNNGYGPSNEIYLEDFVYIALVEYIKQQDWLLKSP